MEAESNHPLQVSKPGTLETKEMPVAMEKRRHPHSLREFWGWLHKKQRSQEKERFSITVNRRQILNLVGS